MSKEEEFIISIWKIVLKLDASLLRHATIRVCIIFLIKYLFVISIIFKKLMNRVIILTGKIKWFYLNKKKNK